MAMVRTLHLLALCGVAAAMSKPESRQSHGPGAFAPDL